MRYLYYQTWQLFKRIKTNDMPATNAMIFITIWQFLNLSLIYILLKHYYNLSIVLKSKSEIFVYVGVLYSILTILNYQFLYKKRDGLLDKYKNETKKQKIVGNVIITLYILGSFILVIYFGSKYTEHM